jgi:hypothetical protein
MEYLVFDAIEKERLARLSELAFHQYVAVGTACGGEDSTNVLYQARESYVEVVNALTPWLPIKPIRTAAQAWAELQERRKDPKHMEWVREAQARVDAQAKQHTDVVAAELELRKAYIEQQKQQEAQAKRPVGQRYVRLPTRAPSRRR